MPHPALSWGSRECGVTTAVNGGSHKSELAATADLSSCSNNMLSAAALNARARSYSQVSGHHARAAVEAVAGMCTDAALLIRTSASARGDGIRNVLA